MYNLDIRPDGSFALSLDGKLLIRHSRACPALFLGRGKEKIHMFRGNFDISDRVSERVALRPIGFTDGVLRLGNPELAGEYRLRLEERDGRLELWGECDDPGWNRL